MPRKKRPLAEVGEELPEPKPIPVLPTSVLDDSRCEELEIFDRLLSEVTLIDRGSNCLERIAECIELAGRLRDHDWDSHRQNFLSWLHERALIDRFGYRDGNKLPDAATNAD